MPGYIRNPAAYAAAVKRNLRTAPRKPFKRTFAGPKAYQRKLRGQGGYFGDMVKKGWGWLKKVVPKGTGRKVGGLIGGALGNPAIGSLAGQAFSSLTGLGSYKVKKNTVLDEGQGPPVIANSHGNVRIRHREFIQDVNTSTNFTLQYSEGINPGNVFMFPWLSGVATSFQQYRLHGCVFEFKSTSSDALNSTNTALGTVILMTDYNVYSLPPQNKQVMENQEYSVSCKPSCNVIHAIECAPKQTSVDLQYVRIGAIPANQDARLYDLGQFNLATVGSQASPLVGELWVSYDVELLKPQLSQTIGLEASSAFYQFKNASSTGPLGTSNQAIFDNIGLSINPAGTGSVGTIRFPPETQGKYLVNLGWYPSVSISPTGGWVAPSTTSYNLSAPTTSIGVNQFNASSAPAVFGPGAVGGPYVTNQMIGQIMINIPYSSTASQIDLSSFSGPTNNQCVGDILVTQVNPALHS